MGNRKRHPKKSIEAALRFAETKGWRYKSAGNSAHAWGKMLCPYQDRKGCQMSIWSTPRNDEAHAKQIIRGVSACQHEEAFQNERT